jgi:tetratricopeptide (TPR) repeat protein
MLSQRYADRWSDEQGNTPGIVLRIDQSTGDHPRATLAETYAQIYKDLDEAIALFQKSGQDRDADEFYLPSIDVAYALYSRAALTRQDWTNAAKYAALAKANHPIMSNEEYFDGMHTPNKEWIWGVYEAQDQTIYYYSFYAYQGSNASSSQMRTYPTAISKELIDQIPETDVRRGLYLIPTDEEMEKDIADKKLNAAGRSTGVIQTRAKKEFADYLYSTSLIYIYMQYKHRCEFYPGGGSFNIFRGAEMYYNEAEALCMQGQDAQAQEILFQAVSPRDPAYVKSTKTGKDLLTEIKLYRRFDLWGEGFDWFDYKRWGDTISRKALGDGGSFHTSFAVTIAPSDGNNWTWELPLRETDYNKGLDLPE